MNTKNIKIGTQLMLGFATMLVFVIVLGIVSYQQTGKIHMETETIYNHPLKVRTAVGTLKFDVVSMRIGTRDLMLSNTNTEKERAIRLIEISAADALDQFKILDAKYLGPQADIDNAYKAFITWKIAHNENTKMVLSGEIEKVKESLLSTGTVGILQEQMMAKIKVIEDFANKKADEIFDNSIKLENKLNNKLMLLVACIILISGIVIYFVIRNISNPINELTDAAKRFHKGDRTARSLYTKRNEYGVLSDSFNILVESIQETTDLNEKVVSLARLMLSKYEAKEFFRETINALASHTGSQMAAVYLLSDDKKNFEHFESLGLDINARQSFNANSFDGEFGAAISSHRVQHIKNIATDTRFTFYTVSGQFIPHEIITIPILTNNEVVAIISLASISKYSNQSIQLIDNIFVTLRARVEGIIAYHKMRKFSEQLELQNSELEIQKTALASQSAALKEKNAELEMQKNQLSEASQLKTNFLSNMSHELRTPLNSVIALSGVLSRRLVKMVPAEELSYLEVIERNGRHLLTLINDILDISRIEAGREEIEIAKFDVNQLVAEIISTIQPQARQKDIELKQTTTTVDLYVTSDANKCHHILQNLIANAVKFTEKGKVEVRSQQNGTNIEISITDTGIGISEIHQPHIFDEFRQADSSTSRKFGGTGLGLAIAKKYANLLGGTISVKSTTGKGSEFVLVLPMLFAAENKIIEVGKANGFKHTIKQVPSKPVLASSVKTILVVEDNESAVIQIKDILDESGYQILVARDGAEALGITSLVIPDAMILDLMMPGIDGFEVLKTLREAEPTAYIPVLILTAKHITKEDLKFLKRNNIHQLIQKGDVNRSELLRSVETMVFPEKLETLKPEPELQPIGSKPVVLVVEDNPDNMITVKALLSDSFTIIDAVNGNEGVRMAKEHKPNLILMDIALPELDGLEAFKAIRSDVVLQYIPVIALTASAMTTDREAILAYGFNAYIAKPIEEKLFFKTINEVLYGK
ncbi:MAG TPA: response regulator [Prolixibacteraceae bacterium]|nr:response regulator [Prolixibacteraceae bacterium]